MIVKFRPNRATPEISYVKWTRAQYLKPKQAASLLQKSDGSRDPSYRQSYALEMTEIWPP